MVGTERNDIDEQRQESASIANRSVPVRRGTTRPIPGRLVAGIAAWLVLFFSLVLAYLPQYPSAASQAEWPAEIPKGATEFRGWPFVGGFGRSVAHQRCDWVGHYTHGPGLAANWTIALLNAIATFIVLDRMRKFEYRVSLNSIFSVMTSIAIALALISNQDAIDTRIAPAMGLLRSDLPPDIVATSTFYVGQCCQCTVLGFALVQLVTKIINAVGQRS